MEWCPRFGYQIHFEFMGYRFSSPSITIDEFMQARSWLQLQAYQLSWSDQIPRHTNNSRSLSITDTVISNCIVSSSSQQQSKEWSSSWQQMQSGRRCLSHHFGGIHINLQLVTQAIHLHKRCFIATDPLTRCRRLNCILPLGMSYDKCSSGKYQYVSVCVIIRSLDNMNSRHPQHQWT